MPEGVNKLLESQIEAINKTLQAEDVTLTPIERLELESLRLVLTIYVDDHLKTATMWKWFQPMVFVSLTALTAAIVFVVTGHVALVITP